MSSPRIKSLKLNGLVVGQYLGSDDPEEDSRLAIKALKELGLYREPSLLDSMRAQADAFAATANLAYEQVHARGPGNPPITFVPFVTNSAFAVEIYLKALLHSKSVVPPRKEHRLTELHRCLPPDVTAHLEGLCLDLRNKYAPKSAGTFAQRLVPISDAFSRWRYAYEYERLGLIEPRSLILVMAVCHQACRDLLICDQQS